jgi:hypothetical protein
MVSLLLLVAIYLSIIFPFTGYLLNRPVAIKLGYTPDAQILKIAAGEFKPLVAEVAIVRVLFYFGTVFEKNRIVQLVEPEYANMFTTLETAVKLDPYNMDAYYFTQAIYTWEVPRVAEVNSMLEYGMKYRTWDYQLPFFAGFNAAFFLQDYTTAAIHMKRAAELSGESLFTTLAARFFYEAGNNDFGILFLETMEKGARDPKVKGIYQTRRKALQAVKMLTGALDRYRQISGRQPASIRDLVTAGIIKSIPQDPYGGEFYLDDKGMIRTTSKFAFATLQNK